MEKYDQVTEQLTHIRDFETHLGVPNRFFESLISEDDWSFIIKLHALVESVSTNILVDALGKPELRDQLSRLPLSDSEYGKLSLMKSLDLVSKPYRGFIRKLSELRNRAVHNVEQTNLNLKELINNSDKSKRNSLADSLGVGIRGSREERLKLLNENPKFLIWISALCLISMLALHKKLFENDRNIEKLEKEFIESL